MALTRILMDNKFYDGKLLWETFMEWGAAASYGKLNEWCLKNGMVNPYTGKVSQMGPYWAMWRWAFNNPEEAYPHYEKWVREQISILIAENPNINQDTFFREKFFEDLKEKAKMRTIASEKEYKEFCKKYGLAS